MKLNQYLKKIEQGNVLNLDRFIQCLPFTDKTAWRKIYSAVRTRGGYILTIEDTASHNALYSSEVSDRVAASKFGRSHEFSSTISHIMVLNHHSFERIPFVVVCESAGYRVEGKLVGSRAILIENIENFYRYHEFLQSIGQSSLIEHSDILFGSGNQICHHLNRSFLETYDVVYCAQDLDLGGLVIYQTLKKYLTQCEWLAPVDWYAFQDRFKLVPKESDQLQKAIELARKLNLHKEADLMNQTRHFMEQEAFLPAETQD